MKKIKVFSLIFIFVSLFVLVSFIPTRANSAIYKYDGPWAYGAYNVDDNPIDVKQELLTFDLYKNNMEVSAEYTFHNSSDEDIEAELIFPIGKTFKDYNVIYDYTHSVYFDNEKIDTKLRLIEMNQKDIVESIYNLSESYVISMLDEYNIYYCNFDELDGDCKVEVDGGYLLVDYSKDYRSVLDFKVKTGFAKSYFYVFAKDTFTAKVTLPKDESISESPDVEIPFESKEINKYDFIKDEICDNDLMYEIYNNIDLYNYYVRRCEIENVEYENIVSAIDYKIKLKANTDHINLVKTCLYEDANLYRKNNIYEIHYYVTPAKTFKSFKNLKIRVNTNLYVVDKNINLSKVKDGVYEATYKELLDHEIAIALSTENITYSMDHKNPAWGAVGLIFISIVIILFIAILILMIAALVVTLIVGGKKKKIKNNWLFMIQTGLILILVAITLFGFFNDNFVIHIIFFELFLCFTIIFGILQIVLFDWKLYKLPAKIISITLESIILIIALAATFVELQNLIWPLILIYLFSLIYIFFKTNFLKDKGILIS